VQDLQSRPRLITKATEGETSVKKYVGPSIIALLVFASFMFNVPNWPGSPPTVRGAELKPHLGTVRSRNLEINVIKSVQVGHSFRTIIRIKNPEERQIEFQGYVRFSSPGWSQDASTSFTYTQPWTTLTEILGDNGTDGRDPFTIYFWKGYIPPRLYVYLSIPTISGSVAGTFPLVHAEFATTLYIRNPTESATATIQITP